MTAGAGLLSAPTRAALGDAAMAGTLAWALSGLPSTVWTLVRGGNPLMAVRAAGTLVLSPTTGRAALLVAGTGAHTVISYGWATVLALGLPTRRTQVTGTAAGLAIAALDLGVIGRRYPAIRALPTLPQVADHLAFGLLVGAVVARRRRRRLSRREEGGLHIGQGPGPGPQIDGGHGHGLGPVDHGPVSRR